MNELIVSVTLLTYIALYVFFVYRAHRSRVGWLSSLLCLAPALYLAWSILGAAHDISLILELVDSARRRTSPWNVDHQFNHLPGFPVLLTPVAWMSQSDSATAIATKVKLLNLVFLIWFGLMAGRAAFPGAKDSIWRGLLYFSCHPLLLAVSLWHLQFEVPVLALLLLSMAYWQSSETGKSFRGGLFYGLAISVKHWPLLVLPVLIYGAPRKIPRLISGIVVGVVGVVGLHCVLNGRFGHFDRILTYSGIPATVGVLQAFALPEPRGWNFLCLAIALIAGLVIRVYGGQPAEGAMFTLLCFLFLSFRTAPQYWVWFLAFAPYCVLGRERLFWLVSGCLGGIVLLLEWGFLLGWKTNIYPHSTWQGNYPDLRDYPHLSSATLWLFERGWRPLLVIAVVASSVWYYRTLNRLVVCAQSEGRPVAKA